MPDNKDNLYDNFEVGDIPKASNTKLPVPGGKKFVIAVVIFILVVAGIVIYMFAGGNKKVENAKNLPLSETNSEVNAVKLFAVKFLDKFYWYNKDSFMDIRNELEKMMTPNFLEKYKKVYYDNQFEEDVTAASLVISATYDYVLYNKDSSGTYARILGDINYTNSMTGASRKRVSVWTLKIVNDNGRYLVDDFKIDIGKVSL